jgi:hypothetical protein
MLPLRYSFIAMNVAQHQVYMALRFTTLLSPITFKIASMENLQDINRNHFVIKLSLCRFPGTNLQSWQRKHHDAIRHFMNTVLRLSSSYVKKTMAGHATLQ